MTRPRTTAMLMAIAIVLMVGCAEQQMQQPQEPVEPPLAELADDTQDTVDLTAYINVTSGCQEWTLDLLDELDEKYDSVNVEIIDFGTPEGMKQMQEEGIGCQVLLFDGSPVLRLPGEDGESLLVNFYFPVGFGWTHDDLRDAFAAIDSGEVEILTEEEAREALAPVPVEMEVAANETDEGAEVLMNGQTVFTITEEAGGQTPAERAEAARDAIAEWTAEPVHPHQLGMENVDDGWSITANGNELVRVYRADAEAADVQPGKKFAAKWFKGIRCGIVAAARDGQSDEDLGTMAQSDDADASGEAVCPVPSTDQPE